MKKWRIYLRHFYYFRSHLSILVYIKNIFYQNVKLDLSYIPIFYYSQDSKSNQWWIADFLDLENLTYFVVELALLSHNHLIILESGSLPYLLQKCFHPLIV